MASITNMSSCAISEISGLVHDDSAVESMKEIAKNPYSFSCIMTFHGVIKDNSSDDHYWAGDRPYIQEFVDLIKREKLGKVTKGVKAENKKFHPGHIIQAFTWAPNIAAVTEWNMKNKDKRRKKISLKKKEEDV